MWVIAIEKNIRKDDNSIYGCASFPATGDEFQCLLVRQLEREEVMSSIISSSSGAEEASGKGMR